MLLVKGLELSHLLALLFFFLLFSLLLGILCNLKIFLFLINSIIFEDLSQCTERQQIKHPTGKQAFRSFFLFFFFFCLLWISHGQQRLLHQQLSDSQVYLHPAYNWKCSRFKRSRLILDILEINLLIKREVSHHLKLPGPKEVNQTKPEIPNNE